MFIAAHWSEEELELSAISLDDENYRIPPRQRLSEDSMINYMFKFKGIVPLAESIVRFGALFPQEKIICLRHEDNSFTVLEGNRRVAALKLLTRPTQFLSSQRDLARLPQITKENKTNLETVPAWVVDSRAVASSAIAGSHIYGQKVNWSDRAKMQFASDRMTEGVAVEEIATELAMDSNDVLRWIKRNEIFEHVISFQEWSPERRDMFWHEQLNLEPFFQKLFNYKIKQHFGAPLYLDDGSQNLKVQNQEKYVYVLALHTLIAQIEKSLRRLNLSDDLSAYLIDVFGPPIIATESHKPTIQSDLFKDEELTSVGFEYTDESPTSSGTDGADEGNGNANTRKSDYSFFRQLRCVRKDDERLCQLCRELKGLSAFSGHKGQLSLERYRLAFSFLIRATLERCFYYHLCRVNSFEEFKSNLRKRGRFSLEDYLKFFSENGAKLALEIEVSDKLKTLRADQSLVNDLHWNIHNDFGPKTIDRIREISDKVRPIIEYFSYFRSY